MGSLKKKYLYSGGQAFYLFLLIQMITTKCMSHSKYKITLLFLDDFLLLIVSGQ